MHILQVTDKNQRKIHLSKERWKHINQEHPEVAPFLEEIKEAIQKPTRIKAYQDDVHYHFKYTKGHTPQFLLVIVKYLNNHGFIITAYLVSKIR